MPNQLSIAGANPGRQTKRTALFNARFSDGVYTLRGAMRDVSSRIEEHYYGSHNDSLTGDSSNVEITPKLTLARRFGNSVWNSNLWTDLNSFYDFRQFNANVEQIKTLVDTKTALYDATNNSQTPIWQKNPASTQSYMQSVGNNLFWGDGFDRKKWLTTLLSRVPYIYSDTEYNPYNFTPFELNSFIIDSNGDVEQLIGTVLQLSSFYILNGTIVFSLKNTLDGFNLPNAQQILEPGLQLYFSPTSEVSSVLGQTNGVTLTVQNLSGGISSASVYFGGSGGYLVGDTTSINQTSPTGGRLGQVQVASIGTSAGSGYTTASAIPTSTPGVGSGAVLSIVSDLSGGLASATISFGGLGYALGDIIYPLQSGGSKGYFKVSSVSGSAITGVALVTGVPKTVSVISAGTGYVSSQNVDTTGGTGSGLTLNIVDDESQFSVAYPYGGGAVTGFILDSPGTGYAVGDILVPLEPSSPAANGAELTITGISGAIGSLTFSSGGPTVVPYTTGAATWTTSGSGVGSTIAITSVSSGQITGVSFTPGSGFNVSDLIYITQGSATGAILEVASVTTNTATGLTFVSGGPTITAYTTGVPTWTTSGSGTGAAFNITAVTSGQVSGIAVTSGGSGFNIGDLINLTQGSATGAVLTVATVSGTTILTVNITTGGLTPYTTASNVSTTSSGSGTGAKINITGVTSGSINSGGWNLAAGGSGYTVGDHIYPTQGLASGASFTVSSVASNGILTVVIGAGGITPYTTGTNIATNTSGSGMGMTINITGVTSGSINSGGWSLNLGGTGYAIGDKIYPAQGSASGAVFIVASISSSTGPIASFSTTNGGTGYVSATGLATSTSGAGTGATVTLSVGDELFFPPTSTSDIPNIFSGGNPISDSRTNAQVAWSTVGNTTIDGSAVWTNRGPSTDGGIVFNWGMPGGTSAPTVVVNNPSSEWAANTYYNQWQFIIATIDGNKYIQQVATSGLSGVAAPWNSTSKTAGQYTKDGTAEWVCLGNDGDTSLAWTPETKYSVGHILEETVSSLSCVFSRQPNSGITTQGSIPAYCWNTGGQSGTDVGAAGQLPGHIAMSPNGGQSTTTAAYSGSTNNLFLEFVSSSELGVPTILGDGSFTGATGSTSVSQLFPVAHDCSIALLPVFVVPAAGTYTFNLQYQCSMFWGIGAGSLNINITSIQVRSGVLTATSDSDLTNMLPIGNSLTFSGLTSASFLNSQTVSVTSVSGKTFTADYGSANYGPILESSSGVAATGNTLSPSVVSGPMTWSSKYNFSSGTPIKGYTVMSANYQNDTGSGSFNTQVHNDTVRISFPSAGVYPAEIQYGMWYHSTGGYTTPTVSPALPNNAFCFLMTYTPPSGSTAYNFIPQSVACSSASAPAFPAWPTTVADIQAISPKYPSVTETSGNYTWWNLGPTSQFLWDSEVHYTTDYFIIDTNSNQEVPYEPGISGTTPPSFSTTLYGITPDQGLSGSTGLLWMNNGPEGSTPFGQISTSQGGWKYVVSLVNTLDDTVSNASPVSVSTGNFFEAAGVFVSGGLPAAPDPQADYVAIFRTDDGGATYYLITGYDSGNGNTEYTLPLSQYLSEGFTDTNTDESLNTLLQAPVNKQNSLPPKGAINLAFHLSRIFVSVGNTVYWSTGPNTPIGNGFNGFSPNNYQEFPSLVTRIIPLNAGTIVFTVSDIYILGGDGTSGNPISAGQPYAQGIGLLNYNALTVNGTIIYFMTTDNQVVELNVGNGFSHIGFPIADLLNEFSPSSSYLTWHTNGFRDQALFVADGSTGWYKMLPTIPPEQGASWCPKAGIVGGAGAVQSVETSPGEINLLLGPPPGIPGPILVRDYNTYQDNGASYPAYFTFGTIVLAHPGQLASIEFITVDSHRFPGAAPLGISVLLGELFGNFENLSEWTNDPPQLPPSKTMWNQRFYLAQSKEPIECRHFQMRVTWPAQNFPDEVEALSPVGGYSQES